MNSSGRTPLPRRFPCPTSRRRGRSHRRVGLAVTPLEGRALLTTPTVTTLGLSAVSIRFSQPETLTATVTTNPPGGSTPTGGTVTFLDGSATLGSQSLTGGTASLSVPALTPGVHGLTAVYTGDGVNFTGSSSPTPHVSTITTVAGTGTPGFSGDGGPATAAALNNARGVAVDASGDIIIADSSNGRVRRVDHATGVITTVAGGGSGSPGDGGPAIAAALGYPLSVALDASGDVFIADGGRVRRVDHATGVITTVAGDGTQGFSGDGGPATAAALSGPYGVAANASGDLFIADPFNFRVRRVDHTTGVITTVAGDGNYRFSGDGGPATAAALNEPPGVAVDASGNLFIADVYNNRVRRVDHATGVITTVVGDGLSGLIVDGGPATATGLNFPQGVAVDASGDLFIDDQGSYRIRRVDHATGVITTVAGNGTQGFGGDGGLATAAALNYTSGVAVDASGNLFIADYGNNRVREVTPLVSTVTVIPSAASTGAGDYNGDGRADLALFDPTTATWLIRNPDGTSHSVQFGSPGDTAAPGDYEGIGKSDLATYTSSTATWNIQETTGVVHIQFGDPKFGDVAAPADFDGDGKTDLAVFRKATDGLPDEWIIRPSSGGPDRVVRYGDPAQGDTPVPGNYLGTGKATLAVFRPSSDVWIIRQADGTDKSVQFGDPTKHEVPAEGDYAGTGPTQLAVYSPSDTVWTVGDANGQFVSTTTFGSPSTPTNVPALSPVVTIPNLQGIAPDELALFRPSVQEWLIRQSNGALRTAIFGVPKETADTAVPGDYQGTGRRNLAVFNAGTDVWAIQMFDGTVKTVQFGDPSKGDVAAPADYDGDGKTDLAVFRKATDGFPDEWIIRPSSGGPDQVVRYGDPARGDTPVPGNYLGTGKATLAVFRPSEELWIIRQADGTDKLVHFGDPKYGDVPAPGAYNNDGMTDLALYRASAGLWIILTDPSGTTKLIPFGDAGDYPARSPVVAGS